MTDKIPEEYKTKLISRIPAGDLGSGEDVSNCVAFLASEMSNYIMVNHSCEWWNVYGLTILLNNLLRNYHKHKKGY